MFKNIAKIFKKSSSSRSMTLSQLVGYSYLYNNGWGDLSALAAWRYWRRVSHINTAIKLITNEFQNLPLVLRNINDKQDIIAEPKKGLPESQILALLKQPNFDRTGREFQKANMASYLVTGMTYLQLNGITGLQEVFWINPAYVNVIQGNDGYPDRFIVCDGFRSLEYKRDEDYRFFTEDGTKELVQIVDFNPDYTNKQVGFSSLTAVFDEMESIIAGNTHNKNMLKKGSRPSGVLLSKPDAPPLESEQRDEFKKQIALFYQGEENAGNVMVLDSGSDFKELSVSNKDMDFAKLSEMCKITIYEALNIPSPFYDNSASTFNNVENARIDLYLHAVIPPAMRLVEEYNKAFMRRYANKPRYELAFSIRDIPALEPYFDESNLRKSKSGVFTINELRELYMRESIGEAGDEIYQPVNLVPVGMTQEQSNNDKNKSAGMLINSVKQNFTHEDSMRILNAICKN